MSVWIDDIKKHLAVIDWFLVITVFAAMAYGYVLIISATNAISAEQGQILFMQPAAALMGLTAMFILSKSDYDHVLKYAKYLYILSVGVLIITLIFGVGDEVGNKNWLRLPIPGLGSVGIQPSELVKISFVLTFSKHLSAIKENIDRPKNIIFLCLHFGLIVGLVMIQGDLGSALVFIFVFTAMMFAAGVSFWYFFAGIFVLVASSPLLWNFMSDNQRGRILAGFNPSIAPTKEGYQALMSQRAIGSGGLFGAGYQKGYMTQNGLVPKQWTDFIYSAAGEEFGFIGALLVLIILTLIVARIFHISRRARNTTGSLICVGVMAIFVSQTIENIGMCLGTLPVIGITLPFFSYGGSSILSSLLGIGVVLSVNSRKNIFYFTRDENLDKF